MRILISGIFLLYCLSASADKLLLSVQHSGEQATEGIPWTNVHTLDSGKAYSGHLFSRCDSVREYSLGYKGFFPDTCRGKNLLIHFSQQVKADLSGNFMWVINILQGDSVVYWDSREIKSKLEKDTTWTFVEDSVRIPTAYTKPPYSFALYVWNAGKKDLGVDDLVIDFYELTPVSFLPDYIMPVVESGLKTDSVSNTYYSLFTSKAGIELRDSSGVLLFDGLSACIETGEYNRMSAGWNMESDSSDETGRYLAFNSADSIIESHLTIGLMNNGELLFSLKGIARSACVLKRYALKMNYHLPLSAVYTKSTVVDTASFHNEYWLDKEGFALAGERMKLSVYRPEKISSIQLDVKNSIAVFNADFNHDHPLHHYPQDDRVIGYKIDASPSLYSRGDTIAAIFRFNRPENGYVLRLMKNPRGYPSSIVWTEHADFTDLRTHRAVYFGSSAITTFNAATGGFAFHRIPVTKSVFYTNPDKVMNTVKHGSFKTQVANISGTEGFEEFLDELNANGYDICLHTPDHFTTTKRILRQSMDFMQRKYNSRVWIDHGYDNPKKSNREDLVCDGLNPKSPLYALEEWKQNGVHYLWNSYFEDTSLYTSFTFNTFFQVPHRSWGEQFPAPEYWRHETRSDDLIHWRTVSTLDPPDGSLWKYYFSPLRLDELVSSRYNHVIHAYCARVDSSNGFYVEDQNEFRVNSEFDEMLSRLSTYRDEGKINLTTIADRMKYLELIEKLRISYYPGNEIHVTNQSDERIEGASFTIDAAGVAVDGKHPGIRREGDLVFWLDMEPGETIKIRPD